VLLCARNPVCGCFAFKIEFSGRFRFLKWKTALRALKNVKESLGRRGGRKEKVFTGKKRGKYEEKRREKQQVKSEVRDCGKLIQSLKERGI